MKFTVRGILFFMILIGGHFSSAWSMELPEDHFPEEISGNIRCLFQQYGDMILRQGRQKDSRVDAMVDKTLMNLKGEITGQWTAICDDIKANGQQHQWLIRLNALKVISDADITQIQAGYCSFCAKCNTENFLGKAGDTSRKPLFRSPSFLMQLLGSGEADREESREFLFPFIFEEWGRFGRSQASILLKSLEGIKRTFESEPSQNVLLKGAYVVYLKICMAGNSLKKEKRRRLISRKELPPALHGWEMLESLDGTSINIDIANFAGQALQYTRCQNMLEACRVMAYNLGFNRQVEFFEALDQIMTLKLQGIYDLQKLFQGDEDYLLESLIPLIKFNELTDKMMSGIREIQALFQERGERSAAQESPSSFSLSAFKNILRQEVNGFSSDLSLYRASLHDFESFVWPVVQTEIKKRHYHLEIDAFGMYFQNGRTQIHRKKLQEKRAQLDHQLQEKSKELETLIVKEKDLQETTESLKQRANEEDQELPTTSQESAAKGESSAHDDQEAEVKTLRVGLKDTLALLKALKKERDDEGARRKKFEEKEEDQMLEDQTREQKVQKDRFQRQFDQSASAHQKEISQLSSSFGTLQQEVERLRRDFLLEQEEHKSKVQSQLRNVLVLFQGTLSGKSSATDFAGNAKKFAELWHQSEKDKVLLQGEVSAIRGTLRTLQESAQQNVKDNERMGREFKKEMAEKAVVSRQKEESLRALQEKAAALKAQIQAAKENVEILEKKTITSEGIAALEQRYQQEVSNLVAMIHSGQHQLSMSYGVYAESAPPVMMPMYPSSSGFSATHMGASALYPHHGSYFPTREEYDDAMAPHARGFYSAGPAASRGRGTSVPHVTARRGKRA